MLTEGLFILGAYLMGSIPTGLWLSQAMYGADPRQSGSRNIGATNVLRVVGKKAAVLTLAIDVLKGLLPVGAAILYRMEHVILFVGGAAVIGHIFPLFLKFRGGKGVAVSLGVFLGIAPQVALLAFLLWLGGVKWSGYSSAGALAAFGGLPFLVFLLKPEQGLVLFSILLSALVYLRHHENIRRLWRGEEKQT